MHRKSTAAIRDAAAPPPLAPSPRARPGLRLVRAVLVWAPFGFFSGLPFVVLTALGAPTAVAWAVWGATGVLAMVRFALQPSGPRHAVPQPWGPSSDPSDAYGSAAYHEWASGGWDGGC